MRFAIIAKGTNNRTRENLRRRFAIMANGAINRTNENLRRRFAIVANGKLPRAPIISVGDSLL